MSSSLVFLPVLLLVLLAFVRPPSSACPGESRPSRCGLLGWRTDLGAVVLAFVLVFGGFLGARTLISDEVFWPNSEVDRRIRWLQRHLLQTEGWETRPVILLVGSSDTHFSIDPDRAEAELERLGTPATVLSFNIPGAIHHERLYMLERFFEGLSREERRRLAAANVLYLGEIFDAYDTNPLYRLEKEAATERAIMFLGPVRAVRAWVAYQELLRQQPNLPSWSLAAILLEHSLLNRFAVGALSERKFPIKRARRTPPFFALEGSKGNFNFEESLAAFRASDPQTPAPAPQIPHPQWWSVYADTHRLLDPFVDAYGFVALPTIESPRARYQQQFVDNLPEGTFAIGPATPAQMETLLVPGFWFDGVHSTGAGAEAVTRWFAGELSRELQANPQD